MSEEITAGGKEFLCAMAWSAVLYVCCGTIMAAFTGYAYVGAFIAIAVFVVFGFLILTHYTARFTYTLKNGKLRINRMIGKRNKEIEFKCTDIVNTYYGYKPIDFPKKPYMMRKSILSKKNSLYIIYKNEGGASCGTVIEPSKKLRSKIEKERKKTG